MSHTPKKITEIWAWIAEEADGGEGIPAFSEGKMMMPLVMADAERMESMRPIAEDMQQFTGIPFKLVKFHKMEVMEYLGEKQ